MSYAVPLFARAVKYLGLLAMSRILSTYPKSVQAHKDLILHCLDDRDESIRIRALDLLYGMVCAYVDASICLRLSVFTVNYRQSSLMLLEDNDHSY